MAGPSCPFPLVEQALAPYIHTRQETQEIRRVIASYLASQLQSDKQTPSHLDLSVPTGQSHTTDTWNIPTGIYKSYLDALAAHERAKEQYETVRAELDEFRQSPSQDILGSNIRQEGMDAGLKEYIDLLRQRQQHRRLGIMQTALQKIQDAPGNPTKVELKTHLKSAIGEPPEPPIQSHMPSQTNGSTPDSIDTFVTRLKKDLILANSRVKESRQAEAEVAEMAKELPEPSMAVKIAALRNTRARLISWVEEELGRVPEDESVIGDDELDEYINGGQARKVAEEVETEVQSLYRCYVDSRAALLADVQSLCARERGDTTTDSSAQSPRQDSKPLERSPARPRTTRTASTKHQQPPLQTDPPIHPSELLPFLPTLITASRNEAALQAQTTYLRRQLATANEDTTKAMQRLAGESYLVPPGASSMKAWAQAAADAAKKTESFVTEQTEAGMEALRSAESALKKMQARREALDGLKVIR